MRPLDEVFNALATSPFRRRFHLRGEDLNYLHTKGFPAVMRHARGFIKQRLTPTAPQNDGRQTPWRGHPVFVAQHATACCCRSCLEKWHRIPRGRELTSTEQAHVLSALERWLRSEAHKAPAQNRASNAAQQLPLQWQRSA
jgi:hypothetical protein